MMNTPAPPAPQALPQCTCGGRAAIQHLAGCPMGETSAPPEDDRAVAEKIVRRDRLGVECTNSSLKPADMLLSLRLTEDATVDAIASALAAARDEARAEIERLQQAKNELAVMVAQHLYRAEAAEAARLFARAEKDLEIDGLRDELEHYREQYSAERRAHGETIKLGNDCLTRAEAAESALAKTRAALERAVEFIKDNDGGDQSRETGWASDEALDVWLAACAALANPSGANAVASATSASPSLRDAALEEAAQSIELMREGNAMLDNEPVLYVAGWENAVVEAARRCRALMGKDGG